MNRTARDILALPFLAATPIYPSPAEPALLRRPAQPAADALRPPARLAIDLGSVNTAAVLETGGRSIPLLFDGAPTLPTPQAAQGSETSDIKSLLTAAGDAGTPARTLYRQLLARIAAQAGTPIGQLVLTVPADWSTRRREQVRQCAITAGLPQPVLVSEAAAAAQARTPDVAEGAVVLVCDLGAIGHFTVVRRTDRGWHQLATQDDIRCGGRGLDAVMAAQVDPEHATDRDLLARCASARADLATQAAHDLDGATAITLPGREPVVYTSTDLADPATAACFAAVAVATDTLLLAGESPNTLAATVVRGGAFVNFFPGDELKELASTVYEDDDPHALCRGALALTPPPAGTHAPTPVAGRWLRPSRLAAIVLPAILGAYLAKQEIDETFTYTDRWQSYRDNSDYATIAVLFDRPAFANAAWLLMMAAIAVGTLLVAALQRDDLDDQTPGAHRGYGGRMLMFTVVVGIAAVVMQGELAQAVISGNPDILPAFVHIALTGVAVPAAVAALAGLLVPLSPRLSATGWADRLHFPVAAAITAAAGSIAGNLYFDGPANLRYLFNIWGVRIGALLMGVAIALTLFQSAAARIALGTIVGLGAFVASSAATVATDVQQQITVAYLITVAFWWLRQGIRLALDALRLPLAAPPAAPPSTPSGGAEPAEPS